MEWKCIGVGYDVLLIRFRRRVANAFAKTLTHISLSTPSRRIETDILPAQNCCHDKPFYISAYSEHTFPTIRNIYNIDAALKMSFTSLPLELHDMVYGFLGVGIKTSTMEVDEKLSIRGRHSRPTDSGMVFKHFEAKRYSKLQSLIRLGATCKLLHAEIGDSLRGDGILEIAPGKLQ